jgi:arylsulfatase A-like enzyme
MAELTRAAEASRRRLVFGVAVLSGCFTSTAVLAERPPHIVLVMADDMGWGQTGYRDHPLLKTPNLDAMAAAGLRFERFYAGAPNCSPTRATVMTGRTNDRTGVENHGFGLRSAEKTLPQALRTVGYRTAHFGKWHLSGLRGPGAPILSTDPRGPGRFGFDRWLSVTNFFDRHPLLSRQGQFEEFRGDSSEILVDEALRFLRAEASDEEPCFTVIWFGTPHSPFRAPPGDVPTEDGLKRASRHHYGELVAMDRSLGTLRRGLRDLGIAENTLLWFCSDNGGLPRIEPDTVGGLRGHKNTLYEGGLRVPAVLEWPRKIEAGRVTSYPACTTDIFPTLADLLDLPRDVLLRPIDGISLVPLFTEELTRRERPLGFRHTGRAAWIDNEYKLVTNELGSGSWQLFHLAEDPAETENLAERAPEVLARMLDAFHRWNQSVTRSAAGDDYPPGSFDPEEHLPRQWHEVSGYQRYLEQWQRRPEYAGYLRRAQNR